MKKYTFVLTASLAIISAGCAVQKSWTPSGGSKSDGIVKLSYEYGKFEVPKIDTQSGIPAATQKCERWGYKNAEPFGMQTKNCIQTDEFSGGCGRWMVTVEYQCID